MSGCNMLFNPAVVAFTVANLAAMGLELNLREAVSTLRSPGPRA